MHVRFTLSLLSSILKPIAMLYFAPVVSKAPILSTTRSHFLTGSDRVNVRSNVSGQLYIQICINHVNYDRYSITQFIIVTHNALNCTIKWQMGNHVILAEQNSRSFIAKCFQKRQLTTGLPFYLLTIRKQCMVTARSQFGIRKGNFSRRDNSMVAVITVTVSPSAGKTIEIVSATQPLIDCQSPMVNNTPLIPYSINSRRS